MKIGQFIHNMVCGAGIGVCMLIPGVSGGTIAVLLGIYNDLLTAMAALFSKVKNSLLFLSSVALGGILGIVLSSRLINYLLNQAPFVTTYFFVGIILGGIGVMIGSGGCEGKRIDVMMLVLGTSIVFSLRFLPMDIFKNADNALWLRFLIMIVMGLMLGAALILPGISFSMTLVSIGIYEEFMGAIAEFDLYYLLPIIFSTLFGVIVLSKILSKFIKERPDKCHSMIIGFVIASLVELFPGLPPSRSIITSVASLLIGISISIGTVYYFKRKRA